MIMKKANFADFLHFAVTTLPPISGFWNQTRNTLIKDYQRHMMMLMIMNCIWSNIWVFPSFILIDILFSLNWIWHAWQLTLWPDPALGIHYIFFTFKGFTFICLLVLIGILVLLNDGRQTESVRHTTRSRYYHTRVSYLDQGTYPENSIKGVWSFLHEAERPIFTI